MADVDLSNGPVRLVYPAPRAGGYAEALPNGMFAVDAVTGISTPYGSFSVPYGQRALYVCLADDERVAFAGGTDDTAYLSGPGGSGGWAPQGPVYGARPLIFDINDDLVIVATAADQYAGQGMRFLDYSTGVIYSGDDTKFDPSLRICEWIRRGTLTAGQAVTDELIVHDADTGVRYLVEPGIWRNIKFRRQGDTLAFAGTRFDTAQAVLLWLTVDQLHTLPVFREDLHTDAPHTDHGDSHTDVPSHTDTHDDGGPVSIPNHQQTVNAINSQYPDYLRQNTTESCGEFTERVVIQLAQDFPSEKWGHVKKVGGQTQYRGHAVDAIMSQLDLAIAIDIIAGAHNPPNPGHPAWMEVPSGGQPWMAPIPIAGGGGGHTDSPHTDTHTDAPVDPGLEARVAALEQNAVQYGQRIGLRMNAGQVLNAVDGGPSEDYQPVTFESRGEVGPHESFEVERGDYSRREQRQEKKRSDR